MSRFLFQSELCHFAPATGVPFVRDVEMQANGKSPRSVTHTQGDVTTVWTYTGETKRGKPVYKEQVRQ